MASTKILHQCQHVTHTRRLIAEILAVIDAAVGTVYWVRIRGLGDQTGATPSASVPDAGYLPVRTRTPTLITPHSSVHQPANPASSVSMLLQHRCCCCRCCCLRHVIRRALTTSLVTAILARRAVRIEYFTVWVLWIIFIHHKHGSSKNNKCNWNINKYTGNTFLQIHTIKS